MAVLYISGVDRIHDWVVEMLRLSNEGFTSADELWSQIQDNLIN